LRTLGETKKTDLQKSGRRGRWGEGGKRTGFIDHRGGKKSEERGTFWKKGIEKNEEEVVQTGWGGSITVYRKREDFFKCSAERTSRFETEIER